VTRIEDVVEKRRRGPAAIEEAARAQIRPLRLGSGPDRLLVIAADHPARGALGAGRRSMGDRFDLLERLVLALSRPHVNGVLGTADVLEDLLLLGALDEKYVFGSMNRGGLARSAFEIDDRFTAHDASWIAERGFDGGKMLLRIDLDDPATPATLESCGRSVGELAALGLRAMVEPFMSRREGGQRPQHPGARGGDPSRGDRVRARSDVGAHVAEGPHRPGARPRHAGLDASGADPRR
jgi:hypothetical protein